MADFSPAVWPSSDGSLPLDSALPRSPRGAPRTLMSSLSMWNYVSFFLCIYIYIMIYDIYIYIYIIYIYK